MEFRKAVEQSTPETLSLRDKDRYLWGKSFCNQLTTDVQQGFTRSYLDESPKPTFDVRSDAALQQQHTITVLVDNKPGVLSRVSAGF